MQATVALINDRNFSSDMTKGIQYMIHRIGTIPDNDARRVMSGIITGPHFRSYFNEPGPVETGTMVAVLEVGAFST